MTADDEEWKQVLNRNDTTRQWIGTIEHDMHEINNNKKQSDSDKVITRPKYKRRRLEVHIRWLNWFVVTEKHITDRDGGNFVREKRKDRGLHILCIHSQRDLPVCIYITKVEGVGRSVQASKFTLHCFSSF